MTIGTGQGKTPMILMIAMAFRALEDPKKVLIVVPNALIR
jgi:reverse gyrase